MFAGGDPVVFFSNAFSNNGFSTGLGTYSVLWDHADKRGSGRPVHRLPPVCDGCGFGAGCCRSGRYAIDRSEFEVPTVLRINAGLATSFGGDSGFFGNWRLNLDYIYSKYIDPLNFVDLVQTPDVRRNGGFTVDGRPIYQAIDVTFPGCNATLQYPGGTPPTYSNVTPDCSSILPPVAAQASMTSFS